METQERDRLADPLALALDLIRCRSVTPVDAGAMAVLERALASLGFTCTRLAFDSGGPQVENLYARRGTAGPNFCFAGHTDVVPTGPLTAWQSDPFVPTERDGWLYARGAADMKGSLAAFVTACEAFVASPPHAPGSIALLLTSDEEGPSIDGTVTVVENRAAAAWSTS